MTPGSSTIRVYASSLSAADAPTGLPAGNASPGATRSYASIRAEVKGMLAEASQADAEEDERLGDARGDELPAELVDARSRRERLRRCKEQLERAQADEQAAYRAKRGEPAGRPSTGDG